MRKKASVLLAAVLALSLAACGKSGNAPAADSAAPTQEQESTGEAAEIAAEEVDGDEFYGKPTDFTYMVATGVQTPYIDNYAEVPALQYALAKEWDPDGNGNTRKVTLDIITPPLGTEQDFTNTLISTGDYPDIMNLQMASVNAAEMYEDGMCIDLTDYVMQYMPNYRAYFERHPELAGRETIEVDGQRRYLCLYQLNETPGTPWGGMVYRRDWIIKYGSNPETGEAFSGEWDEEGNWHDNVVFPSGETYPKYVSDWEWMLDIFKTALDEQGITDGYAYSVGASGENGVGGDMESGFGSANTWYIDPEEKKVVFGGTSDAFRTYLEMMHNWYEKGWVDPSFYEHADDLFFMVDVASVYSGKVGSWYGIGSVIGKTLDVSEGNPDDPTNDIVVLCAPTPINDVYGDESVQGFEPFLFFNNGLFAGQIVVTDKAQEKDLPALLTFMDYFYGKDEGSVVYSYGLSEEQVEELRTLVPEAAAVYDAAGLKHGAYSVTEDGKFMDAPEKIASEEVSNICVPMRFNGLGDQTNIQLAYEQFKIDQIGLYQMYDATAASIGNEITAQLTPEQSSEYSDILTNLTTYDARVLPEFITGEKDIKDDEAWQEYCDTVEGFGVQTYCDYLNEILGVD